MKLSFNDKCWLVANIKRVFALPAVIFFFIILFTSSEEAKKGLKTPFVVFGFWSILILIIIGVVALKYAYQIAKFAETNFDQVVSRRTKWKLSNVELHEMKFHFMWETFGWALFSIYMPFVFIVWLICFSINV